MAYKVSGAANINFMCLQVNIK